MNFLDNYVSLYFIFKRTPYTKTCNFAVKQEWLNEALLYSINLREDFLDNPPLIILIFLFQSNKSKCITYLYEWENQPISDIPAVNFVAIKKIVDTTNIKINRQPNTYAGMDKI